MKSLSTRWNVSCFIICQVLSLSEVRYRYQLRSIYFWLIIVSIISKTPILTFSLFLKLHQQDLCKWPSPTPIMRHLHHIFFKIKMPDSPTNGQAGAMSHKLDILSLSLISKYLKAKFDNFETNCMEYLESAAAFLESTVIESEGDYRQVTQIKKISAISGVLCSSLQSIIISLLSSKFNFSTPREGQSTAPSIHFLENALERPFPIVSVSKWVLVRNSVFTWKWL